MGTSAKRRPKVQPSTLALPTQIKAPYIIFYLQNQTRRRNSPLQCVTYYLLCT
uniref:Uncharacterized protein n=1 Tax=Cyprinus carpio TaxID=7962 RepID=A0A8C2FBH9_CYPCA